MTTLRILANQFIDDISGQSKTADSRWDEREVVLKIRQLLNEVMILAYFGKYQEGDRSAITQYISTYKLPLQNDSDLNRAFVTLPEGYAALPYNRGIHRVFFKRDDENYKDVVISHNPSIGQNTKAGRVPDVVYGYLEGFNVFFRNLSVEPDDDPLTVVAQLIIAAPDTIGLNDPLPVVPEQVSEVMKRLMASYRPTPIDLAANGNPQL
jgi:hypothetical protein